MKQYERVKCSITLLAIEDVVRVSSTGDVDGKYHSSWDSYF